MKLLYLAFVEAVLKQVLDKINDQIIAMKKYNKNTIGVVIGRKTPDFNDNNAFYYIDTSGYAETRQKEVKTLIAMEILSILKPDIVYFRYPGSDKFILKFMQNIDNIVFEHQTKEINERALVHDKKRALNEKKFGGKCISMAKGIIGVTEEIALYELKRAGKKLPVYVLPNGINVKKYNLKRLLYRSPNFRLL